MRRQTVQGLYSDIESGRTPRDIAFDEDGPLAFVGSQSTTEIWYGERMDSDEAGHRFRILKLSPSKSRRPRINQQTGRAEISEEMTGCRYVIGDVRIPPLGQQTSLGRVIRAVQERFNQIRNSPLDHGNVNGGRTLSSLHNRWFVNGN